MSKYGILVLGIVSVAIIAALYRKKGRGNMGSATATLEKITDEQFLDTIGRIQGVTLPADENGNAYVDAERYPELYDWVLNG